MKEEYKKQILRIIKSALDDDSVHIQFTKKISTDWAWTDGKMYMSSRGMVILIETGTHEVDLGLKDDYVFIKRI